MCVEQRGTSAEWTQCFISMGWASQGQRIGPDKDTISPFLEAFFLFLMVSNPAMPQHTVLETNRKKNTSASKHGFIMSAVQIDEMHPLFLFEQDLTVKQAAVLFHLKSDCQTPLGGFLIKWAFCRRANISRHKTKATHFGNEQAEYNTDHLTGSTTNTCPKN